MLQSKILEDSRGRGIRLMGSAIEITSCRMQVFCHDFCQNYGLVYFSTPLGTRRLSEQGLRLIIEIAES